MSHPKTSRVIMANESKFTTGLAGWDVIDDHIVVYTGTKYAPAIIARFEQPKAEADAALLVAAHRTAQTLEGFGYDPIRLIADLPKVINMIIWDRSYVLPFDGVDSSKFESMLYDFFMEHCLKGKWKWMPGHHFVRPEFPKNQREEYIKDAEGKTSAFDVWDEYMEDLDTGKWLKITRRSFAFELSEEELATLQQIQALDAAIAERTMERDNLRQRLFELTNAVTPTLEEGGEGV